MKNKTLILFIAAVVCSLYLGGSVFAAGSGHKAMYGLVKDQNGNPVANQEVQVFVVLSAFNITCFSQTVQTADDGTYSIDLYTLETDVSFNCRKYWNEFDKIWVSSEDYFSAESEIECFDDLNCPGAQQLPDITIDVEETEEPSTPSGGSGGGGGGGGGSSDKEPAEETNDKQEPATQPPQSITLPSFQQKEYDLKIINFTYGYDGEKDEITFSIIVQNNKDSLARFLFNNLIITDLAGNELLDFKTGKKDIKGLQTKEFVVSQSTAEIESGTYYADALLFKQGIRDQLQDAFTDLQLHILKPAEKLDIIVPEERKPFWTHVNSLQLILIVQIAILMLCFVVLIYLFTKMGKKHNK